MSKSGTSTNKWECRTDMAEEAEEMLLRIFSGAWTDHLGLHFGSFGSIYHDPTHLSKIFKKIHTFFGTSKNPMENIHPKKRTSDPNGAICARFPLEVACWLRDLGLVAYILRRPGTYKRAEQSAGEKHGSSENLVEHNTLKPHIHSSHIHCICGQCFFLGGSRLFRMVILCHSDCFYCSSLKPTVTEKNSQLVTDWNHRTIVRWSCKFEPTRSPVSRYWVMISQIWPRKLLPVPTQPEFLRPCATSDQWAM